MATNKFQVGEKVVYKGRVYTVVAVFEDDTYWLTSLDKKSAVYYVRGEELTLYSEGTFPLNEPAL